MRACVRACVCACVRACVCVCVCVYQPHFKYMCSFSLNKFQLCPNTGEKKQTTYRAENDSISVSRSESCILACVLSIDADSEKSQQGSAFSQSSPFPFPFHSALFSYLKTKQFRTARRSFFAHLWHTRLSLICDAKLNYHS